MTSKAARATKRRLDKVKRMVQQTGLHVKEAYETSPGEYVVTIITNRVFSEVRELRYKMYELYELYELGLTVTHIYAPKTNNRQSGCIELHLSDKENARSVLMTVTHDHERMRCDCAIYENLEKDAADCMSSYVPMLHEVVIDHVVRRLKRLQEEYGYDKFYQAIRYVGLFGKYDTENCVATCLICKQKLLAGDMEKGDAPVLHPYVDGSSTIKNNPVVVFAICDKCYQNIEAIHTSLIGKEINLMLYSKDTRWIQSHKCVKSPFAKNDTSMFDR